MQILGKDDNININNFSISKTIVEARSKKLSNNWCFEIQDEIVSLNTEEELLAIEMELSQILIESINREKDFEELKNVVEGR